MAEKLNELKKQAQAARIKAEKRTDGDFMIVVFVLALTLFGLVMIFSSSYYQALSKTGDPYKFLKEAAMWTGLGWIVFIICANIDYRWFKLAGLPAIVVGFILLFLIFTPLGKTINNATRWLDFKFFTVMPGEVMKTCVILFYPMYLAKDPERIRSFTKGILPLGAIAIGAFFLIYKQPNFSTAGLVVLICAGMMFVAGLSWWLVGLAVGGGIGLFLLIINLPQGRYMLERVQTFFDPFMDALGSGYQVVQGLLALGSGGIVGVGLGKSVQKMLYLPEAQNDFILAIIGEELGYLGVLVLMFVYLLLIWRCFKVCVSIKDYYGMMLATGITLHLALQVILNIAVVSASFPPTGVILPFVSQGGNASILFLMEMGILFNISRHTENAKAREI
ncbi:MAG: cell division protein FtsW [Firmicutes bacterium]|nr:cell division protein FtsW [Bacillota bacterium]